MTTKTKIEDFLNSIRKHWGSLVTSGSLIGLLSIWQGTGHAVWPWTYWLIAISGFGVACFQTWQDQQSTISGLQTKLQKYEDKAVVLRSPLYAQLGYQYLYIIGLVSKKYSSPIEREVAGRLIGAIDRTSYNWAKSQADTFYSLSEALHLDYMYRLIDQCAKLSNQNGFGEPAIQYGREFLSYFEKQFLAGGFDSQKFQELAPGAYAMIKKRSAGSDVISETQHPHPA